MRKNRLSLIASVAICGYNKKPLEINSYGNLYSKHHKETNKNKKYEVIDYYSLPMDEIEFNYDISNNISDLNFKITIDNENTIKEKLVKEIRIKYMCNYGSLENKYAVGIDGFELTNKWAIEILNSLNKFKLNKVGNAFIINISIFNSKITIHFDNVNRRASNMDDLANYTIKNPLLVKAFIKIRNGKNNNVITN